MNFKVVIIAFFAFAHLAIAAPILRLHDGKNWSDVSEADWKKLPQTEISGKARDGNERRFSGVSMEEILKLIEAPSGPSLRGPEMNLAILIKAADGYQVVFSLAELDPSFRKQSVIIADSVDGQPLTEFEGKRMLVSAGELRHSRWIRQIISIHLVRVETP